VCRELVIEKQPRRAWGLWGGAVGTARGQETCIKSTSGRLPYSRSRPAGLRWPSTSPGGRRLRRALFGPTNFLTRL
jgi:hypothetical protein